MNLKLNGIDIEEVSLHSDVKSVRVLGVEVDPDLTWSEHIKTVASKLKSYIHGLRRIRFEVDLFARAFIMSTIQFAIEIWGSASKFHMLEKLQKQGIRLIKAKSCVIPQRNILKFYNATFGKIKLQDC